MVRLCLKGGRAAKNEMVKSRILNPNEQSDFGTCKSFEASGRKRLGSAMPLVDCHSLSLKGIAMLSSQCHDKVAQLWSALGELCRLALEMVQHLNIWELPLGHSVQFGVVPKSGLRRRHDGMDERDAPRLHQKIFRFLTFPSRRIL